MTPTKSKKPLPSSISTPSFDPPETFQQWKAALEQVNRLYLRGQWKQCAAQCDQLLLEAKTKVLINNHAPQMSLTRKLASSITRNLSPLLFRYIERSYSSPHP